MERMFVLQFLDGPVLAMEEGYLGDLDGGEIMNELMEHVPLDASLYKRLLSLKQGSGELVGAFLIRFNQVVVNIEISDKRVRGNLVEAVLSNKKLFARSMLASDNSLSYDKVRQR